MRHHFIIVVCTSLVALASCTGGKVYDHYEHTPIAGWDKVDTLTFNVPALQDSGRYVSSLGLRINNVYPFQSLTLIVEQTVIPASRKTAKAKTYTDTLTCKLFNQNGSTRGQGISYYQYHFHISEKFLHQNDSLHITVRHDMKREIMQGVADVGISLTAAPNFFLHQSSGR